MTRSMLYLALGSVLALTTSASPIARPDGVEQPATAAVKWYQSPLSFNGVSAASSASCGFQVSAGTITPQTCVNLHTLGVGIAQSPTRECKFKMWTGTTTCSGDGSWTEVIIPQGNMTTCLDTGVYDGGRFTQASGIYSCH